ncbi:MAG: hypothetical protein Q7S31_02480 [bacterium]|nr:hypothetical protein [bacterium]
MLTVSYNLSATLKERLAKADALRKEILLTPASPVTESTLRWQATLAHLQGWASLSNQPLTADSINSIVNQFHSKTSSPLTAKVLHYRNSLNYVREFWPANPGLVTFATIKELATILGVNPGPEKEVQSLLDYLQTGQVHPIIQSATAHLYFYPSRLAYLVSLLFLTKHNYDLRGWLSLEDFWNKNKSDYLQVIQQSTHSANTTLWLEYFGQAMVNQISKIQSILNSRLSTPSVQPSTKKLGNRQKEILSMLEKPEASISNVVVQNAFNVSQITASRDLAKLVSLGRLFVHGSGRSTYYTRV